ncbi:MAG: PKD domain-containing protein [Thermoplasmata archaeon]|nr:PKD domain-containing protein [Thermoplasmata archaeon]MBE6523887.1 PKD domain-containing protein [Thermoplasmata archaeon]
MQYDIRTTAIIIAAVFMAVPFALSESDADQAYDKDYGEFYSYTLQFVFDGAEAQTIDWDFGDGSEHSTEWNPRHTYAAKGTYYVTQTTSNPKGTTVEVYKVQIMGFPVITFESNGGSAVPQIEQTAYNVTASKPIDPIKADSTFDGWFTDQEFTNPMDWDAGVNRSMTLYAKWTPVQTPIQTFTVTFDSNGGSPVQQQTVQSGSVATVPVKPTKAGFAFSEWRLNGQPYDFGTSVTGNIVLVATWTENTQPVISHNISFDVDGGSIPMQSRMVSNGTSLTLPSYDGTRTGFTFGGWTYSNVTYQPGNTVVVTGDMTFKAIWTSNLPVPTDEDVTVSFDVAGGSSSVSSVTVKSGTSVTLPDYSGSREGHSFGGWAIGMLTYQPGSSVTVSGDITAKAIWIQDSEGQDKEKEDSFLTDPVVIVIVIALIIGIVVLVARACSRRF